MQQQSGMFPIYFTRDGRTRERPRIIHDDTAATWRYISKKSLSPTRTNFSDVSSSSSLDIYTVGFLRVIFGRPRCSLSISRCSRGNSYDNVLLSFRSFDVGGKSARMFNNAKKAFIRAVALSCVCDVSRWSSLVFEWVYDLWGTMLRTFWENSVTGKCVRRE